jgi:hypothetical protein
MPLYPDCPGEKRQAFVNILKYSLVKCFFCFAFSDAVRKGVILAGIAI